MARTGGIRFYLSADTKGLNKGLSEAQRSVDRFAHGAGRLSRFGGAGLAGVVGGLTSIGGAAEFVRESVTATNDLYVASKRLSTVTGMDVQQSSAWVSLAKSRGIQADSLTRSYTALSKQVGLAQRGGKDINNTFRQLGVTGDMLKRGNTQEILGQISEGLSKHADGLGKTRVASQLFGRNYQGMLRLLNGGRQNLRKLLEEEYRHGPVLDKNTKNLQRARAEQIKFNESMEKLKLTVGEAALPYITKFTAQITKWLQNGTSKKQIDGIVKAFAGIAQQAALVAQTLVPIISGVGKFVGKHPEVAKIVADMIAFKLAIKMISFVNPIRGIGGLAKAVGRLGPIGLRAGERMAQGIARYLPSLGTWMANAFASMGETAGTGFAARFAAKLGGKSGGGGGGILGGLLGGLATGAKWLLSTGGKVLSGVGAGLTYYFSTHGGTGTTSKNDMIDPNRRAFMRADGWYKGRHYNSYQAWQAAHHVSSLTQTGNLSLPSLGSFTAGLGTPTQNTSQPHKKADKPQITAMQAMTRAAKLRHWANPYDVRLARISIHDHTVAADRRRKNILEQGVARWRSVRSELKRLANDAQRAGDAEIASRIWDIIHRGDSKVAGWKVKLATLKDSLAIATSQEAIDNANRKVQIAQDNLKAEDAFLRAAFGFGDIGTGGINGIVAAGGAITKGTAVQGGNVNIQIQSLHPGDSKTKAAIGHAVTAAFVNQGARRKSRTKIGA